MSTWLIGKRESARVMLLKLNHCRDVGTFNVMMDPSGLFSETPHPCELDRSYDFKRRIRHYTRTQRPPKYYIIDFGLSCQYSPDDTTPLAYPLFGGDRTVPEFQNSKEPRNPFPTDIYYLGNMIREDFLQASGFDKLQVHASCPDTAA